MPFQLQAANPVANIFDEVAPLNWEALMQSVIASVIVVLRTELHNAFVQGTLFFSFAR